MARMLPDRRRVAFLVPALLVLALLMTGCTVTPTPLDEDEVRDRVAADRAALEGMRAPVTSPMSLSDAIARALLYNLDFRVDDLSRLVEEDALVLAKLGLLPDASGSLNFTQRDRQSGSVGESPADRPTTSRRVRVLQAQWSILDFGVSYLAARRAANEGLAAEERRRRAAGRLVNDVAYYFHRALYAGNRLDRLEILDKRLDTLLELSGRLGDSHLDDPLSMLTVQVGLYQLKRRISGMRRDLELAQESLARLLNMAPDDLPRLVGRPDGDLVRVALDMDFDRAVDEALFRRPELREFDYQRRNARLDVWRSYLEVLPNVTGTVSQSTDSNTTSAVRTWTETGVSGVFKLFSLVTFPWKAEQARLNERIVVLRRLAMSLAVMEQVRSSRAVLEQVTRDVGLSQRIAETNDGIVGIWSNRLPFGVTDELLRFRAEVDGLLTHIERDDLLAEQQRGLGDLLLAIGLPLAPEAVDLTDEVAARAQVGAHLDLLRDVLAGLSHQAPAEPGAAPETEARP